MDEILSTLYSNNDAKNKISDLHLGLDPGGGGGGGIPSNRLMGMCRWMGSHFHDWIDYNGVAFSTELLEWVAYFWDFGERIFWHVGSLGIKKNRTICDRKMRVKYVFCVRVF